MNIWLYGLKTRKVKITSNVLKYLFPPRCAICDRVIEIDEVGICKQCRGSLSYLKGPCCLRCGKEISSPTDEYCYDCGHKERTYIKGYPVFNYVPPVRESLMAFKYQGRREYADFFAAEIYKKHGDEFRKLGIEALVPVPIFRKKLSTRGYNQAEVLARELGRLMKLPVITDIVVRTEDTPPQKELSDEQRETNMKSAFSAGIKYKDNISNKTSGDRHDVPGTVLLVDDIYTTGATIESCTRVCKSVGIKNIYYAAVAVGKGI